MSKKGQPRANRTKKNISREFLFKNQQEMYKMITGIANGVNFLYAQMVEQGLLKEFDSKEDNQDEKDQNKIIIPDEKVEVIKEV